MIQGQDAQTGKLLDLQKNVSGTYTSVFSVTSEKVTLLDAGNDRAMYLSSAVSGFGNVIQGINAANSATTPVYINPNGGTTYIGAKINLMTAPATYSTGGRKMMVWNETTEDVEVETVPSGGGGGGLLPWTEVTGSFQTIAVNNGYISNNAGLVVFTLPAVAAVGDIVEVAGEGAGGW